jgi:hypothetical protein
LLALTAPRDQFHERATRIAHQFVESGGRFVGTGLVLSEFHALLVYRAEPIAARNGVRALLSDPAYQWLDVSIELIDAAVASWLMRFSDQRFSLTDAVSFEIMHREKIRTAFAFDHHFVTAGFELLDAGG